MKPNVLRDELRNLADISFVYNGKRCGVVNEVHDSIVYYEAWCGNNVKQFKYVDELMKDKMFDGKSLEDISDTLDIDIY